MTNSRNLFSRVYRKSHFKQAQVLGLMASPRKKSNTDILLDTALKAAEEKGALIDKIIINELSFLPCQDCDDYGQDGRCKINDDFQKIYEAVLSADSIIVASPIYFGSITAQLKMAIDRFQCHWKEKFKNNKESSMSTKKGGFICIQASSRSDFFNNAKAVVRNFFATASIEYSQEVFCFNIEEKGSVYKHQDCIAKAKALGEALAIQ